MEKDQINIIFYEKNQIKNLINKLVKKPDKILSVTNLTKHTIEPTDPTPIKNPQLLPPTSPAMLKIIQNLVDQYLEEDIIEPCKSP